jgi:hypothetical protein
MIVTINELSALWDKLMVEDSIEKELYKGALYSTWLMFKFGMYDVNNDKLIISYAIQVNILVIFF